MHFHRTCRDSSLPKLLLFLALSVFAPSANARWFTDDQGRQVDAELVGVRGEQVVLAVQQVRGLWPLAKLSAADQAYVREWQASKTSVKQITVQATERDGIGERGEFKKEESAGGPPRPGSGIGSGPGIGSAPPPPLPIAPPVETSTSYRHYEITLANPGAVDASHLRVAYVVYVIHPDGTIGISPGSQNVAALPSGKTARLITEGVSAARTKTKQIKLSLSNHTLSTREKTVRSKEEFGGVWVRVSGPDGQRIGETRRLAADLEKLNPPWEEAEVKEDLPVLKSLGDLLELVKRVLPPPPGSAPTGSGKSGPPGLPGPPPPSR